jgi:hypothetical protein
MEREAWGSEEVLLPGHPKVLGMAVGDHALTVFLFFFTAWISTAGPRSANIINYMKGVDFGPLIWSSLVNPAPGDAVRP